MLLMRASCVGVQLLRVLLNSVEKLSLDFCFLCRVLFLVDVPVGQELVQPLKTRSGGGYRSNKRRSSRRRRRRQLRLHHLLHHLKLHHPHRHLGLGRSRSLSSGGGGRGGGGRGGVCRARRLAPVRPDRRKSAHLLVLEGLACRLLGGGGKQGHVSILLGNNKCTKRGYWGGGAYSSWWVGQASCLPYRRPQESTL